MPKTFIEKNWIEIPAEKIRTANPKCARRKHWTENPKFDSNIQIIWI